MIEVECAGGWDAVGGEEGMGASVVAGGDASPVLQADDHALDLMALAAEQFLMRDQRMNRL